MEKTKGSKMFIRHLDERARSSFIITSLLFLIIFFPILTVFSSVSENMAIETPETGILEENVDGDTEVPEIKISIISPLNGEQISGSAIVIVAIEPATKITSAWFEIDAKKLGELSSESNFSSDFNTAVFENGQYIFSVHACVGKHCSSEMIEIEIKNPIVPEIVPKESPIAVEETQIPEQLQPTMPETSPHENQQEEQIPDSGQEIEKKYSVRPSNIFSAAVFYNDKNEPVASGTDAIYVPEGKYSISITFFDSAISSVNLSNAFVGSNALLFEVDENIDANNILWNDQNFYLKELVAVRSGLPFEGGVVTLKPSSSEAVFVCEDWDFEQKKCSTEFSFHLEVINAEEILSLSAGSKAFGFAGKYRHELRPPDFNADYFEKELSETQIKKQGKKRFLLSKMRQKYLANEMPIFEFQAIDDLNEALDVRIEAYVVSPDGKENEIDKRLIVKKAHGFFAISVPVPRSFKAGKYTLKVKAFDGNEVTEHYSSFEWGLVAVNTEKSIYAPYETAIFHIVVLDRESYGVSGAEVNLAVIFPNGETKTISTINGAIKETTSSGVYIGELEVGEEGLYRIMVQAKAPGIDAEIQSSFEVRQNVPFEIIRRAATKIDPAVQPNKVEIWIKAFEDHKRITVREFVPADFEIFGQGKDFSVKEKGDVKIIEWKNVELSNDGEITLVYYYSVPDKKPWLYNIGPAEIESKSSYFAEARAWMIAVDANPTTIFFMRRSADWLPSEPMPNAGQLPHYLLATSWSGFGMNDVSGTAFQCHSNPGPGPSGSGAIALAGFTSPPLVAQTIGAATWTITTDMNESAANDNAYSYAVLLKWNKNDTPGTIIVTERRVSNSELTTAIRRDRLAVTGNAVTFNRGDKLYAEYDVNAAAGSTIIGTVCFGGNVGTTIRDSNIMSPSIRLAGNLNTAIVSPSNNSDILINTDFDVNVEGRCINYSCGDTNVTLMYCINPAGGCSQWFDMNTDPQSPLYISAGNYFRRDDLLDASDTNYFVFTVRGTVNGTYSIRSKIDSIWSEDINYSHLTNSDINIRIILPPNYSFSLSYPASGCTYGKGSIDQDNSCDRAYFEPTDLVGLADQNKVDPEGQNSLTPFFVYDNQSTGENDMNFTLHLNSALPSTLKLKVSRSYNGWAATCTGDTSVNCVQIDTTPRNIGKAVYSTGTQDLNIFIFADFIGASVGTVDRNAISTSIPS